MNILSFSRQQVVAMADSGLIKIESVRHWDVCNALKSGKTIETVAEDFRMHERSVAWIKQKKCYACR